MFLIGKYKEILLHHLLFKITSSITVTGNELENRYKNLIIIISSSSMYEKIL